MEDAALARVAEREQQDIAATWLAMVADLRKGGPFAKMILSFRESATAALSDLVFADAADPKEVRRLQDEVKRYMTTIQMIAEYREGAAAADANAEAISEDDEHFITTLIEDDL